MNRLPNLLLYVYELPVLLSGEFRKQMSFLSSTRETPNFYLKIWDFTFPAIRIIPPEAVRNVR